MSVQPYYIEDWEAIDDTIDDIPECFTDYSQWEQALEGSCYSLEELRNIGQRTYYPAKYITLPH